ncbi:MAG: ATP-binding protein [Eubacterium sp.]|nr:ATP-binding protein [Eubacterium sp.]MCM1215537.1 ATP-binding protein [Lachnospiraceae bacterium]MCM1302841.1 ATP-binding protein [Butyrivibrio sp.]MCM1343048.1 ATP-binding protein [Muribaculaceae bacterium]MCM1239334.1 ATP-binding protein [Lachnospiraceae bacterium]
MRKTLYLKFILAYVIFGIFSFIIMTTFVPSMTMEHLVREKAENLYAEATRIANTYANGLYTSETDLETVKTQLDSLAIYLESVIRIINPSGRLVMDTETPINVEEVVMIEEFDPTVTSGSYYMVDHFFDSFEDDMLNVIAPITTDYKVKGYVTIHCDMADIQESCNSLLNISYITLVILLLLSLIILIFFTEIVYIPLRKITYATEQYAEGNMHYEFQVDSDDEMGYLAACLNYMASQIAGAEDDQKKFVANVSHDFRSPLTSIRGYLEAMIDGTIPPEMHEKYLNIVLNETDRLTKLTNSLLMLNNLNTKGMLLDRTDFDINKVIRNTAASFEGTCRQKTIAIELILTGQEMLVNADVGRIQQVLYNLIDNAIKFSHHDSVIKIETSLKKNKLFVSVKDTGIGIPKDDLKLIWDRFYKSDLSRGRDKKGTGLGLSIVKEIINCHGEHINVISTEGAGSEFIFSLALSVQNEEED